MNPKLEVLFFSLVFFVLINLSAMMCFLTINIGEDFFRRHDPEKQIAEAYAKQNQWVIVKIDKLARLKEVINYTDHIIHFDQVGTMSIKVNGGVSTTNFNVKLGVFKDQKKSIK